MHLRRSFALTAGAVLLAGSGLSGCGFNYATDMPYNPAEGTNNKSAPVDVLNAVVVAGQDDSGTLIATFVNPTSDPHAVTSVAGAGEGAAEVSGFESIELRPDQLVNLADEGGFVVTGDFRQGDMLTFGFEFDSGEAIEMRVPVVRECNVWSGLDISTDSTDHAEPAEGESTDHAEGESTDHAEGTEHGGVSPYSCEYPEDQGGGH